jgi:hypothetical protein
MLARASRQFAGTVFEHFSAQNICHKNVFQVIVVLLSRQLFDFNDLSLIDNNVFYIKQGKILSSKYDIVKCKS